jgi:transposase
MALPRTNCSRGAGWWARLTAAGSGEEVVPASDYRALQSQVRELQRLLGKKTLEAEILKEAVEVARDRKWIARSPLLPGDDR